jgi:sigma-B regulation protein RsbU (phosphoserine phosphatase)
MAGTQMVGRTEALFEREDCVNPKILIADDQPDVLEALRLLLKSNGYEIESASSPAGILSMLESREFDLILMDLNYARDTTSGREGIELLKRIQSRDDRPPVVVMTGWGSVGLAVESMQRGVGDFVEKPWSNARLLDILGKQVKLGQQRREARRHAREGELRQIEIAEKLRKQEREIEEALRIQEGLLPTEIPQAAGYEIAATWRPARVVAGDYYDVLRFDAETMAFCIADVAGKGMPAALLMSNLQATVRGMASKSISPEKLCAQTNELMCRNITDGRFITFFFAVLDERSGRLRYCNAGHPAPFVIRKESATERLQEGGCVLGLFPAEHFDGGEVILQAGDRLVLFTDGVAEAHDANGDEFGEAGVLRCMSAGIESSAETLLGSIMSGVAEFSDGELEDDATVLVMAVSSGKALERTSDSRESDS